MLKKAQNRGPEGIKEFEFKFYLFFLVDYIFVCMESFYSFHLDFL